jgi:hypothetical protein
MLENARRARRRRRLRRAAGRLIDYVGSPSVGEPPAMTLEREEHVEQAYFFRALRERMAEGQATQTVLEGVHQEILATSRLPYAIQFLATEMKHSGLLSSGFARLSHYFTAFQTFVIASTEDETKRFSADNAFLVLEREAAYRAAGGLTRAGLFVYQFEVLCRNRLGYDHGVRAMAADAFYDADWKRCLEYVRAQIGLVELAEVIFVRSDQYVREERRRDPAYEPELPPLFGEKEGKIARANVGRDPLYLFAALQRQLGYPEVPRPRSKDDLPSKVEALQGKVRELSQRLKLLEAEARGKLDLSQFAEEGELPQDDAW